MSISTLATTYHYTVCAFYIRQQSLYHWLATVAVVFFPPLSFTFIPLILKIPLIYKQWWLGYILLSENKPSTEPLICGWAAPVLLLLLLSHVLHCCCLLFPLCNWDAETLTELIYCDGELCNVEGNTDYYINAHTHMFVKENVIWHHVWRASSIVLQGFVLMVSCSQAGRGENIFGDCFLHCWILVSMCTGVYCENHTSVWLWETGYWNGIALLAGPFIILTNHTLKQENNKT